MTGETTESNETELARLRAELAVYEDAQEIAHVGSWRSRVGPETELWLTAEARRILGIGPSGVFRNMDLFGLVHPDDRDGLLKTIVAVRATATRSSLELRITRPDGVVRLVLVAFGLPPGEEAPPGGLIGTIQDITDQHLGDDEERRERLAAERDLEHALVHGQLFLEYQPIVSLASGRRVIGAEALVRWEHPSRGRLEPTEFISFAEGCGLIVPLGAWVIEEACRELQHWRDAGIGHDFRLSINLSPAQLAQNGFVDALTKVVEAAEVPWTALVLEVTESILVDGELEVTLRELQGLGAHIAIDDFGTKYSALGYLPRLPIDTLKIDASFVRGIDEGPGRAVVAAIAALGTVLGLGVVAEGVESEAELRAVCEVGCHAAQGFLFSPPLSGAELLAEVLSR